MKRLVLISALVGALAGAVVPAGAFFFTAADQEQTVTAARASDHVRLWSAAYDEEAARPGFARQRAGDADAADPAAIGENEALTVDLGTTWAWSATAWRERAFRLAPTDAPGGPVGIDVQPSGDFDARLVAGGLERTQLAQGVVGQVDLRPHAGLPAGTYERHLAIKLAFGDGTRMRYTVPVRFAVGTAPAPAPLDVQLRIAADETENPLANQYAKTMGGDGLTRVATRDAAGDLRLHLGAHKQLAKNDNFEMAFTLAATGAGAEGADVAIASTTPRIAVTPKTLAGVPVAKVPADGRVRFDLAVDDAMPDGPGSATLTLTVGARTFSIPVTWVVLR